MIKAPREIAVIDCGTNTFNLLIAVEHQQGWKALVRRKKVVKLGAGGIKAGRIAPERIVKAIEALADYRHTLEKRGITTFHITGTAALRDARNGPDVLSRIKKETGFQIELIDGEREAELIRKGVAQAIDLGSDVSMIMDIGGGSTEFILCNSDEVFWKKSYRLGAARLLEEIYPSDPISANEQGRLQDFLENQLADLESACKKYRPKRLIGSSGSFDTFAAILRKKECLPPIRKSHYCFDLKSYHRLHKELVHSSYKERLKIPGMLRMRADMIVLASLLLTFVLQKTRIGKLELSTYALKEGILSEMLAD